MSTFDLAVIETGNGGDLQLIGNDLAVVGNIENMPYLGMFGGNVEQSTTDTLVADSKDWWGNGLLMKSNPSIQFNSTVERVINKTALTSSGRVVIENAIKNDLQFLLPQATITVSVSIVATDRLNVNIKIVLDNQNEQITIINFKKSSDGDFFIMDFNNDFLL
jgi:hypothetical protein